MLKAYYQLTKPGIICGNLLTAAAGFFLASGQDIDFRLLLALLVGISLVIASACVFNNYIDRNIDKLMARTKTRALASGLISVRSALTYATLLGTAGFLILAVYTNPLTILLGATAMLAYLSAYGYAKRRSAYGTLVGTISGSLPPVAGYTAVTNSLDLAAGLLFLILVCWQMPHFYAIAIFRIKEYKAANIPVWPIKKGMGSTKLQMIAFMIAFILASLSLTVFDYASYGYAAIMAIVGLVWLGIGLQGLKTANDVKWARKVFGSSLVVLLIFSVSVSVDSLLF